VCVFPPPYPCGIRIGASGDLPMRRKGPFHGRGPLPRGPRPHCLLSLESNREFPVTRTVGWKIGSVSWWCAPLSSAQSMRRRRIPLRGMPGGGKSAKRSGASGASEPAGRSPQEAVLWWLSTGGNLARAEKSNFSLSSSQKYLKFSDQAISLSLSVG
jgi:hypothetical protein